jgi:hypothetical protein
MSKTGSFPKRLDDLQEGRLLHKIITIKCNVLLEKFVQGKRGLEE